MNTWNTWLTIQMTLVALSLYVIGYGAHINLLFTYISFTSVIRVSPIVTICQLRQLKELKPYQMNLIWKQLILIFLIVLSCSSDKQLYLGEIEA